MSNRREDASFYIFFHQKEGLKSRHLGGLLDRSSVRSVQPVGQPGDILDSMLLTGSKYSEARKGNSKRRNEGRVAWPASHMGRSSQTLGEM